MSRVLFSVWFRIQGIIKNVQDIIQRLVQYSGYFSKYDLHRLVQDSAYYSKYDQQCLVQDSAYYSKMSMELFSVWFSIQGIIQNATSSDWLRTQCIIKKCPGYYSAYGSGFFVLFKNVQGIIQRMVQYSAYY